ncbi:Calmodulin-1 [Durusdinium trenchii]|uniref:Calmodulin-1 n=1 Tax=Durusdinium trenchii TaxID=1381693 RepID=A0ABP0QX23_9DINO
MWTRLRAAVDKELYKNNVLEDFKKQSMRLMDQDFHVRRSVKDLKFRKSRHSALHAGVLDLLLGFKDDPAATTGLREAFQAAEFSGSGTARTRTTMRTAAGQEEQPVELVVLRSRGHDPRGSVRRSNSKLKDRDDDARCCCDAETEWPCYVVGISSEPWPAGPPVGAVASARSRNSGPEPAPERASGRSPGGRRNSGASNSLMPSDEGGSADASVISAARDQQKLIGIGDNHSSSVFDIQPPTVETEGGRKSFSELVELGAGGERGSGTFGTVLRGTFYGASVVLWQSDEGERGRCGVDAWTGSEPSHASDGSLDRSVGEAIKMPKAEKKEQPLG